MAERFDYFVVFAEMRTGSNFLETNLNALADVVCHGEAFNPHFIGYPNRSEILGVTREMRDADPARLLRAIRDKTQGLGGFRFFHDHEPRVLDQILEDPRCAKIVLTRNPAESYVSWKIAQATGQWKLTNIKRRKEGQAVFDAAEFEAHVACLQTFQIRLLNRLQTTGQTAFWLDYEDLQSLEVINGLASYLGSKHRLEALDATLKRQNPSPIRDKVANFGEMERALSGFDWFDLGRTPNFEPRRGAAVPGFVTGAHAALIYMPVRAGPEAEVIAWLAGLDGVPAETLPTQMNQRAMRQWKRRNKGHRSFTVIRHPLARAHAAFCQRILQCGPGSFLDIRKTLRNVYKLPIPTKDPGPSYDRARHRAAFLGFLKFLKLNLAGQTNIRVDAHWATQASVLEGMARFSLPDLILRENEMNRWLPLLAREQGYRTAPPPPPPAPDTPFTLADIYGEDIETLAAQVYQRDYVMFGFGPWHPGADGATQAA